MNKYIEIIKEARQYLINCSQIVMIYYSKKFNEIVIHTYDNGYVSISKQDEIQSRKLYELMRKFLLSDTDNYILVDAINTMVFDKDSQIYK